MKSKRQLPLGLLERQKNQRDATVKEIRCAVETARALEMPENNETLLEISKLKIGVLYKGHVQNCLSELGWGKHKVAFIPAVAGDISREHYFQMQRQVQDLEAKLNKALRTNEKVMVTNSSLAAENKDLKEEKRLLLGQMWVLQKKIEMTQPSPGK